MSKKYLITIILNLLCFITIAQTKRDTTIYPMFFPSDSLFSYPVGTWVDDVKKANGFRMIISPDTISGSPLFIVNDCYLNGDMKFRGKSAKKDISLILHGPTISYYSNREPKEIVTYNMSRRIGEARAFYPNGRLYFAGNYNDKGELEIHESRDTLGKIYVDKGNGEFIKYDASFTQITDRGYYENTKRTGEWKHYSNDTLRYALLYKDGTPISGTGYDNNGKATPFAKLNVGAEYIGGLDAFQKFISSRIHYTERAKQASISGKVYVQFVVDGDGSVVNIKVVRGIGYGLDEQAMDVIKLTSKKWKPALQNGVPVSTQFTVPINFGVEMIRSYSPDSRQAGYNLNSIPPL
jgi:TonB family protein